MCGIAALIQTRPGATPPGALGAMVRDVAHRGPDGEGRAFLSPQLEEVAETPGFRVGLGHRRLSIIDLSTAATQPMRRGGTWVVFNGEIYNYVELRAELERGGARFDTQSDTEVILAAYEAWGTACFRRFKGMWGLVLVDATRKVAIASRDRLGIKPLYIDAGDGFVAFASELKQLLRVGARRRVDEAALAAYLATGYEDQRRTFFEGIAPLAPGTWASFDLATGRRLETEPYWHPERVAAVVDDPDEAGRAFAAALRLAVKEHLRSDVPVGCALSGGLDSSAIAVLVKEQKPLRLETFTATFPGEPIDERSWVEQIVSVVGATPHWVTPSPQQFLEELDRFVWIHDEPVGSLSQYAGWCVARLTREAGVPVTLNGQGGDEVLTSYWQSYLMHLVTLGRGARVVPLVTHLGGALAGGNPELLRQLPVMGRRFISRKLAARGSSAAQALDRVLSMSEQERRVYEIREMYLPRLLKWDDRNFMAFGVEGRYPFLDHELIELALSFSPRALYDRGWMKEPLRRGLAGVVPEAVLRRRTKLGFETPQQAWLDGPLRGLLELDESSPAWRYLQQAALRGTSEESVQARFRALMVDRWLKRFFA